MIERRGYREIGQPEFGPCSVISMRVVAYVERNRASPSSEIKRLFRIHRQHRHPTSFIAAGWIVIAGLPKLTVANDDVVGRRNRGRPITGLELSWRPAIVLTLPKINNLAKTGHSPDIGIQIAGAAFDPRVFGIKSVAEGYSTA